MSDGSEDGEISETREFLVDDDSLDIKPPQNQAGSKHKSRSKHSSDHKRRDKHKHRRHESRERRRQRREHRDRERREQRDARREAAESHRPPVDPYRAHPDDFRLPSAAHRPPADPYDAHEPPRPSRSRDRRDRDGRRERRAEREALQAELREPRDSSEESKDREAERPPREGRESRSQKERPREESEQESSEEEVEEEEEDAEESEDSSSSSEESDDEEGEREEGEEEEGAASRSPTPTGRWRQMSRSSPEAASPRRAGSPEASPGRSPPPEPLTPSPPVSPVVTKEVLPPYLPAIQGCRNVEEFNCLNRIEEGTYGVVYRAIDKRTKEIVALKRLKMENEKEGFPITCCALCATLHDNWILHRDLKTSNLLLSHKGILKVGDFGLAREYGSPLKQYTPIVVTLWYRAPELLLGCKEYSCPIDMWSSEADQINRIFKELGTPNEKIWPGYSELPAIKKMTFSEYPYNQLANHLAGACTEKGVSLMNKLLTYDPKRRLTADEALAHSYFDEQPRPIEPGMFPTWPAKSEMGHKKTTSSSPKPPSGRKNLGDDDMGFQIGAAAGAGGFSLKF
ncbi:Cyclin-dependent kinase 11B [Amphibalanus amphitrite]|uniref:Cyclin-dependent kinase 11B n=1 Tax=Amphibalanus amphitrite TaxID=1232801 RepID=A0A6A4W768_AMPAM|nr:Cyclin-dependent kinase 11B [Amphibalanus amphitrite]